MNGKIRLPLVLISLILVFGCGRKDSASDRSSDNQPKFKDRDSVPDTTDYQKPDPVVSSIKFGPAGEKVRSFFKNWEFKRYMEMKAQTVNSREADVFVKSIENTLIRCRNMKVLSEEEIDGDWMVEVSMEVTSIESALATFLVNLKYNRALGSKASGQSISGGLMGIERYMPIRQAWRVVNLDGQYLIDLCAGDSKGDRHDNVMNYILDGRFDKDILSIPGRSEKDSFSSQVSLWLAMIYLDLDIPAERTKQILTDSAALMEKGEKNLSQMVDRMKGAE